MTHRSNGIWLAVAASLAMILGTIVLPSEAVAADASYVRAGFVYDDDANSVHSSVVAGAPVEQLGLAPSASGEIPATGSIEVSRRSNPKRLAPTSLVKIPSPSNTKLQNYVDQLFKHANQPGRIGDGTTMAALPSELAAGAGPHIQKATEIRNGLSRWLTTSAGQNASAADRAIAQDLFDQLDELLP